MPGTGSTSTATMAAGRSAPSKQATGLTGYELIAEAAEIAGVTPERSRQVPASSQRHARPGAGDRPHPGARDPATGTPPSATWPPAAWSSRCRRPAVPPGPDPWESKSGYRADRPGVRPGRGNHRSAPDLSRAERERRDRQGGRREAADDARPRGRRRCPARRRGRGRAARDLRGIETGLAVMTARPGLPVWATLSTSGLEQVALPASVNRIVILADHDASGADLAPAETAARRLRSEGREVVIAMPSREGDDFNDLLREGRPSRRPSRRRDTPGESGPGADRPRRRATLPPTRACRSCAPTRAISAVERPGACCSPRTARPGSTATPASRPGSCPTTRAPGRRHPDRGAPASHAGPSRRLAADERRAVRSGAAPTAVVKSVLATPDPGLPVLVGIVTRRCSGRSNC